MTEVAAVIGPSFPAVWAQPFHLTLLAFIGLRDRERIARLEREADGIAQAWRMNAALVEPKRLQREQARFRTRLGKGVHPTPDQNHDALAGEMLALAALFPVKS